MRGVRWRNYKLFTCSEIFHFLTIYLKDLKLISSEGEKADWARLGCLCSSLTAHWAGLGNPTRAGVEYSGLSYPPHHCVVRGNTERNLLLSNLILYSHQHQPVGLMQQLTSFYNLKKYLLTAICLSANSGTHDWQVSHFFQICTIHTSLISINYVSVELNPD